MSSLISCVSRLRSALLIGRSWELISCDSTARTRWSSSAWSRLASYSWGPSCFKSSAWTSCLSSSRRSCSALSRRAPTRLGAAGFVRGRMPPSSPPPLPPPRGGGVAPAWSFSSAPRGGGAGGGVAPDSLCLRAAASRSARLLTMSPLDPEELGEPVVLHVHMAGAVRAGRPCRLAGEERRQGAERGARRVVRAGGDDRRARVGRGSDVD